MTVQFDAGALGRRTKRITQGTMVRRTVRSLRGHVSGSRWQEGALLLIALVAILLMRRSLAGWESGDYTLFLSRWFEFLQQAGFAGLGQEFADYNMPYLYLLYVGTLTPLSGLEWVKLVALVSDVALAAGSFALLRSLNIQRFAASGAAVLVLLLPEVLLNSAVWGQADSLYSALIVWSLVAVLRARPTTAMSLLSLALAFKLQALFVVPGFALAFVVHRYRLRTLAIAALVFLSTYLPALLAGRSIGSLLSVYSRQAGQYRELAMNAPSLYAWLPAWGYDAFKNAGTLFALAVVAVLLAALVRRFRSARLTPQALLHVTALFGLLVPFLLPAMHERYFFTGDVLLFLLAVTSRRLLIAAAAAQVVAVQAYTPFLFSLPRAVPLEVLVLVELGVLIAVLSPLFVNSPRSHLETPSGDAPVRRLPLAAA